LARHLALRYGALTLALAIASPALGAGAAVAPLDSDVHVSARGAYLDVWRAGEITYHAPIAPSAPCSDIDGSADLTGEAAKNRRMEANFPAAFIFESHTASSLALGPAPLHPPAASPERPARGVSVES